MKQLAAILLVTLSSSAFAEDKLAAESAFRAAKELERAGKLAEACPLYEASYRADPQLGALLNLANCHEVTGRTGTAWVELREAIELATRKRDARLEFAQQRLAALEPRLVRLRIDAPAGVTVARNTTDVTTMLAQDLVVDPGTYQLRATAPNHVAWETAVAVDRPGETVRVQVPRLAPIAEPTPKVALSPPPVVVTPRSATPRVAPPRSNSRRTLALAIGGTGLAALGVGTGFGLHARGQWSASRDSTSCDDHNVCNDLGRSQIDAARRSASIATWAVSGGAALIVAAGVVWLTAPSTREARRVAVVPSIDPREISVTAIARF